MLAQGAVQTGVLAAHSVGFACAGLSLQTIPDLRHPHCTETRRAFWHPKAEGGFVRSVAHVSAGCDPASIRVSRKTPIDFSVRWVRSGADSFSSCWTLWVISRSLQKLEARGFILVWRKNFSPTLLWCWQEKNYTEAVTTKASRKIVLSLSVWISVWILTDAFAPKRYNNQDWPETKFLCSVFWILEMWPQSNTALLESPRLMRRTQICLCQVVCRLLTTKKPKSFNFPCRCTFQIHVICFVAFSYLLPPHVPEK